MLRVKSGEIDQLGLLFERYHKILFSFFYNLNKNVEISEDLVQNVFYRILKYKHRFKGSGEFKAWMFHIAKNVNYDYHRKKRIKYTEKIEDWKDKIRDNSISTGQQMIQQEDLGILKKALQKLDSEKREIIVLSKLQGMKYQEIGNILGYSEGNVKVKVFRALKALKKAYQELDENT